MIANPTTGSASRQPSAAPPAPSSSPGLELMASLDRMDLPDPETLLADPEVAVLPERGDLRQAVLDGVVAAVRKRPEKSRWDAAWTLLARAMETGAPDVVVVPATTLAALRQQGDVQASADRRPPVLVSRAPRIGPPRAATRPGAPPRRRAYARLVLRIMDARRKPPPPPARRPRPVSGRQASGARRHRLRRVLLARPPGAGPRIRRHTRVGGARRGGAGPAARGRRRPRCPALRGRRRRGTRTGHGAEPARRG
ncbi:hypothetical protein SVIOM342S_06142 [Streptomyces violaceorubidus]